MHVNHGEGRGGAVLEARDLCKSFGRGDTETPVLKNVDIQIFQGEFIVLIGPSGSGKSTLLSILGLLEPPSSGDVLVDQTSVTRLSRRQLARLRGRKLGYVFQSFNLLAGLTVAENVMLSGLLAGAVRSRSVRPGNRIAGPVRDGREGQAGACGIVRW